MNDAGNLAEQLCVAAGMIMEDAADIALIRIATASVAERAAQLEQAGRDIQLMATAAAILERRWPREGSSPVQ